MMINIDKIVKLYRKDGITNNLIKLLKIDKSDALNFKLLNQLPDDVKNNIFKTLKYYLLQHLYDNYLDDESIKFYKNLNKSQIDYLIEQIGSPIHKYGESKSKLIENIKIINNLDNEQLSRLYNIICQGRRQEPLGYILEYYPLSDFSIKQISEFDNICFEDINNCIHIMIYLMRKNIYSAYNKELEMNEGIDTIYKKIASHFSYKMIASLKKYENENSYLITISSEVIKILSRYVKENQIEICYNDSINVNDYLSILYLLKTNANLDRKKAYSVILTNCNSCEIATYLKLLKTSDLSESEFYGLVRQAGKKYNGASGDIIAQIDRFNLPEKSIKQLYIDMFINLDTATERARESMLDFD